MMMLIQMVQICVLALGPGIFSVIAFGTAQFLIAHQCDTSADSGMPVGVATGHCRDNPGLDDMAEFRSWLTEAPQVGATIVEMLYFTNYLIFLWVHRIQ